MKYCSNKACAKANPQPKENFHKRLASKDGLTTICKSCCQNWRDEYKDKKFEYDRKRRFSMYWPNLTYEQATEEYNKLFEKQGGCCIICDTHQLNLSKGLFIDHDHETGQVRGLLCVNCNSALGKLQDNAWVCYKAYKYLEQFEE